MPKHPFRINKVFAFIIKGIVSIFVRKFGAKANISEEIININEPFLLLANHVGTYDPFLVNHFIKKPIHFISSDAVFRDPLIGFLFKKLGVIPKKKNTRDTQVIRDMINVAKAGGAIGLFPAGTRTWTGTSLPFDPVVAKLVKMLKIPVVTARMKGLQLANPRWGLRLRRTKVEIDYKLAFTKEQVEYLTLAEISLKIESNISHDEVRHQKKELNIIYSNHRAEFIEHVLFLCWFCKSIGQIKSEGNNFKCLACQNKTHINAHSFFESSNHQRLPFDNIRDASNWQRTYLESSIQKHYHNKNKDNLFSDNDVLIYKELNETMVLHGTAAIYFNINQILISFKDEEWTFFIKDIEVLNPQFQERIEVTHKNNNYRFVGNTHKISGLKWEIACSVIWTNIGQSNKLSTYLDLTPSK